MKFVGTDGLCLPFFLHHWILGPSLVPVVRLELFTSNFLTSSSEEALPSPDRNEGEMLDKM